jgi:signal transduction histidine kinase
LAPQTFNKSRQALLKVLASQAAIAIANARLYQEVFDLNKNLEQKVLLQTKNLQLANSQLQDFNLELNKINQDMTKAKEDAEKANRFKSIFLAQMTHDLRTPLHVIIGSLDMLRKQNNIAPDQLEKSLDISLKSAEKQLSLVNDILDISKIESGKTEMSYKNFNIEELFIK